MNINAFMRRTVSFIAIFYLIALSLSLAKGKMALAVFHGAFLIIFFILVILYHTIWKEKKGVKN